MILSTYRCCWHFVDFFYLGEIVIMLMMDAGLTAMKPFHWMNFFGFECPNAHAKVKKWIFNVEFLRNCFEFDIILNDFWSSSDTLRFKFHSLGSKFRKIPEINLMISNSSCGNQTFVKIYIDTFRLLLIDFFITTVVNQP